MKRAHENSIESTFLVLLISSLEEKEDIKGMNYVANSSELSKPSYPGNLISCRHKFTFELTRLSLRLILILIRCRLLRRTPKVQT